MVKDSNKRLTLTLPKDVIESIDMVVKAFRDKGVMVTKSTLILSIYVQWLDYQNNEIEVCKAFKGGKKRDA